MTFTNPANQNLNFAAHHAWFNGGWTAFDHLHLPIGDLGFRQGVTVVERLRTYNSIPFELDLHAARWLHSLGELKIQCEIDADRFNNVVHDLLDRNSDLVRGCGGGIGITLFATPQSCAAHLNPIDEDFVRDRNQNGQPVVVTALQSPPNECWSRQAKVRSRIHYYLADLAASEIATANSVMGATGMVVDADGSVLESSIANLAIVELGQIVSPPRDRVLAGVTQQVAEQIASDLDIPWAFEPITKQRLRIADEVLLMGTDHGIWFASHLFLEGRAINQGSSPAGPPEICRRLQNAFAQRKAPNQANDA